MSLPVWMETARSNALTCAINASFKPVLLRPAWGMTGVSKLICIFSLARGSLSAAVGNKGLHCRSVYDQRLWWQTT